MNVAMDEVLRRMRGRSFIDLRKVYEPHVMQARGFDDVGAGR